MPGDMEALERRMASLEGMLSSLAPTLERLAAERDAPPASVERRWGNEDHHSARGPENNLSTLMLQQKLNLKDLPQLEREDTNQPSSATTTNRRQITRRVQPSSTQRSSVVKSPLVPLKVVRKAVDAGKTLGAAVGAQLHAITDASRPAGAAGRSSIAFIEQQRRFSNLTNLPLVTTDGGRRDGWRGSPSAEGSVPRGSVVSAEDEPEAEGGSSVPRTPLVAFAPEPEVDDTAERQDSAARQSAKLSGTTEGA